MIGIIDSGVGGINVLCECAKLFEEDFVYLLDNKFAPYGNKSKKKLYSITKANINYLIKNYNLSCIVIACNTISSMLGQQLKSEYKIPIILTIPNVTKLLREKKEILFFATKNTIKYNKKINYYVKNKKIKSLYIKNLAKIIDDNINNLNQIQFIFNVKLNNNKFNNISTIALGCTHFKLIKNNIQKCFNHKINFFEYEKDIAKSVLPYINKNINESSFKIILTNYNYPDYIKFKTFLLKSVRESLDG